MKIKTQILLVSNMFSQFQAGEKVILDNPSLDIQRIHVIKRKYDERLTGVLSRK